MVEDTIRTLLETLGKPAARVVADLEGGALANARRNMTVKRCLCDSRDRDFPIRYVPWRVSYD
jgi:hypothetical protein